MTPHPRLKKYVDLSVEFLEKRIDCDDYRGRFFELHKAEPPGMPDAQTLLFQDLFDAVESCEPDPEILEGLRKNPMGLEYFGEDELRERVAAFVRAAS